MRALPRLLLAAVLATPIVASGGAAAVAAPDVDPPVTVVVTLADDLAGTAATERPQQAEAGQNAVLDDLPGDYPTDVTHLTTGNVVIATVTPAQRAALAADPRVAAVGDDAAVPAPVTAPDLGAQAAAVLTSAATAPAETAPPVEAPADTCTGTADAPQLEPEALGTMNVRSDDPDAATAAALGYDGDGVTIGIVTTNLDPADPDFIRPDGTSVVVDYRVYGAGGPSAPGAAAEAFGDASSIGAQGGVTHDLADIVNPAAVTLPGGHCYVRVVGVAPAADLVIGNIQDQGTLTVSGLLQAVDYAVTVADVDVISESLGFPIVPDAGLRSAVQAVNAAAVEAGVVVVASSGDAGANNTISVPAAVPGVIAVGATTTLRTYAQTGALGISRFGDGTWDNGAPAFFSSSGTTMTARTIDLVAPGFAGWSACSPQPQYQECGAIGDGTRGADLIPFAGTSQSAPFVAGVAALVIQAYRDGHAGADPTPAQVRRILTGTASDLGLPADVQGNGQVDARAAVLAARNLPADDLLPRLDAPEGADTLVASVDRIAATGSAALPVEVDVTNTGGTPVPMTDLALTEDTATERTTYPIAFAPDAVPFLDGLTSSAKQSRPVRPLVATSIAVEVPADLPWARLQVLTGLFDDDSVPFLQVTAVAPDGGVATAGYSTSGLQLTLPAPAAGTWTVVVQTAASTPFAGVLALDTASRATVAVPTAATTVLAPGATTRVSTVLPAPATPGDRVTTLRIADRLQIPVVLRRPVDLTGADTARVTAPLLPTAGRAGAAQQTQTWDVDVPAGRRSLTAVATVPIATSIETLGIIVLVDPTGLPVSITSTLDQFTEGSLLGGLQASVADPAAGRWQVQVQIYDTLVQQATPGLDLQVDLSLDAVAPTATGLPDGTIIPRGTSVPVSLSVRNPGPDTIEVVGDARTADSVVLDLAPAANGGPVALPVAAGQGQPIFLIPPFSSDLTATATSTTPATFGVYDPSGSRNALAAPGTASRVTIDGPLTAGPWDTLFTVPGAVADIAPTGTGTVTAQVRTRAYDTTVTTPDGTAWMAATGAGAAQAVIDPGAAGTLNAVLTADAPEGTLVTGFLAVLTPASFDTGNTPFVNPGDSTGTVLAVFPYSYTVGAAPDPTTTQPTPDPTTSAEPTTTEPTSVAPTTQPTSGSTTPAPTTGGPTTSAHPTRHADGPLAYTGTDARTPGLWGLGLLAIGAVFVIAGRRRAGSRRH